ncbi:MAG TPA: tRNA-dihydrouridine synthase, partial [Chthonomonadales bacterium]|nr:tRNA-dihydrouridine synthase [Chthonomonadales bacterium]
CWVPKVCKTGGGAAMMNDEESACRVARAIVQAVPVPVTVKTRAGWDYGHLATAGLARRLESEGIAAFALHARFAMQGHSGDADWDLIAEIKQAVNRPVVGNGDIRRPQDALRMLAHTRCDGVMIGRGAIANPWLVRDTVSLLQGRLIPPAPSAAERIDTALLHAQDLCSAMGEDRAVRHLRGQLPLYVKGYRGAAAVREKIVTACTLGDLRRIFSDWHSRLSEEDRYSIPEGSLYAASTS